MWSYYFVFDYDMSSGVLECRSPPEQRPAVSLCWPDHKMQPIEELDDKEPAYLS